MNVGLVDKGKGGKEEWNSGLHPSTGANSGVELRNPEQFDKSLREQPPEII